ncbi:unnamed protein product [Vitrella brassicaformis CCMP3155]|uniref:Uncharacterized protein n=3 Tax=Vitrella brassicaformis TaxID=1169539 RepID=A0A0G4FL40_VITBC|nr:unnamed protein product [Vitrella brassicaformis CCMP3155]|eukprot:CEM14546.1 unnamed protein product [Vitrella brassicaformis CCMP3155]
MAARASSRSLVAAAPSEAPTSAARSSCLFNGNGFAIFIQTRGFEPPSKRTWSKQHFKIKFPRPLVDPFAMHALHPIKEWWRERKLRPDTFMGFPDVTKIALRGGSIYHERMDPVTLSVITDKCVQENLTDEEIWSKLCQRAQQIVNQTYEPDLGFIYRAHAQIDWYDQYFVTSYLGRIHRRLHMFQLTDCALIVEAMANPKFYNDKYLEMILDHMDILLTHRDDFQVQHLATVLHSLKICNVPEQRVIHPISAWMLKRDLSSLHPSAMANTLEALGALVPHEADRDLAWSLTRELRPKLDECSAHDLVKVAGAVADMHLDNQTFIENVMARLIPHRHKLSAEEVASATYAFARCNKRFRGLYAELAIGVRETIDDMTATDLSKATFGFLSADREAKTVEDMLVPKIRSCLGDFEMEHLTLLFDACSRARETVRGVDVLAGLALRHIHRQLPTATPSQLATLVRSAAYLQPEASEVLTDTFTHAAKHLPEYSEFQLGKMFLGVGAQDPSHLPARESLMDQLVAEAPRVLQTATAGTVLQMVTALARFPPEYVSRQPSFLTECTSALRGTVHSLAAPGLVALSRALWRLNCTDRPLFDKIGYQLEMKRYDLPDGELERAAEAFDGLGLRRRFQLEPPRAVQQARQGRYEKQRGRKARMAGGEAATGVMDGREGGEDRQPGEGRGEGTTQAVF